jgi:hypothetical protein
MCPLTTSPKAWSYLGNLKEHIALIAKDYVIAHQFSHLLCAHANGNEYIILHRFPFYYVAYPLAKDYVIAHHFSFYVLCPNLRRII